MSSGFDWKGGLMCFAPTYITHEVAGQELRFYPISLGLVFKLKTLGRPMAKSLMTLFGNKDQDHGTTDRMVQNEMGSTDREIVIEPITEGMAKIRHEQRTEAVESLFDAIADDGNASVVAEILMDSLRDQFPRENRNEWPPPLAFIRELPLPALGGMLTGVVLANKEVFGPLAGKVSAATEQALQKLAKTSTTTNPDADTDAPEGPANPIHQIKSENTEALTPSG